MIRGYYEIGLNLLENLYIGSFYGFSSIFLKKYRNEETCNNLISIWNSIGFEVNK